MSRLIDALKGLLEVMSEYSAKPTTTLGAEGATSRWQMEIRKIIAEHQRSDTPLDEQGRPLKGALAMALEKDRESYKRMRP